MGEIDTKIVNENSVSSWVKFVKHPRLCEIAKSLKYNLKKFLLQFFWKIPNKV